MTNHGFRRMDERLLDADPLAYRKKNVIRNLLAATAVSLFVATTTDNVRSCLDEVPEATKTALDLVNSVNLENPNNA